MKICKLSKCDECFYPCLLCKNHDEYDEWGKNHDCRQTNHICKVLCQYCINDDKVKTPPKCIGKCGHPGPHNCGDRKHTCGKKCSLSEFVGCSEVCSLTPDHDQDEPCKCSADLHRCNQECSVPGCKLTCNSPHNAPKDHQHICFLQKQPKTCPFKCQVKCWRGSVHAVKECGRPCTHEHDHQIQMGAQKIGHICDQTHPCPELCDEKGNCKVNVELKHEEKTYQTGAGSMITYNSYAEANAERLRCCTKIPIGLFAHVGNAHKCFEIESKEQQPKIHSCNVQCDSCKYFCKKQIGHPEKHKCEHGNMRDAIFYASEENVNTGGNRKYKVGDKGVAEMCNIFCERLGRGHIHLQRCEYSGKKCYPEPGRRHETKKYMPNPDVAKDELTHGKYWRKKNWEDPCNERFQKEFDLCDFICQHPSHAKYEAENEDEIDDKKYCSASLWHKPCDTGSGHGFRCYHPFGNAHVIFICDISGSMGERDGGNSKPEYQFILESDNLDNRLGALYSAIHKFITLRLQKHCFDTISAVMFNSETSIAAKKVRASEHFVHEHLLHYKPGGGTSFGAAFYAAKNLISEKEDIVMVFLTDGSASDSGSSQIVADLAERMGQRFALFCILLGPSGGKAVLEQIARNGKGKLVPALTGNELGQTFSNLAKQMNTGTFGNL